MRRHLLIAWRLAPIDGRWNAVKFLFGCYRLADWEKGLLAMPKRRWDGVTKL